MNNLLHSDLNDLQEALNNDPESVDLSTRLAQSYCDRGWYNQAIDIYKNIMRHHPEDYGLLLEYGNVCCKRENYKEAISIFSKLTELKPDRIEGWNNLGIAQLQNKSFDAAYRSFVHVLQLEPENAGALCNMGNYFDKKGDFEKAAEYFLQAVKVLPDFVDAWYNLGNSLLKQKQNEKAIDAFQKSLRYAPEFGSAFKNIGFAYEQTGDWDSAVSWYKKALAQKKTDASLYVNIANVFVRQGLFEDAIDHYFRAVKISHHEVDAWDGLRFCSLKTGDIITYINATKAILSGLSGDEIAKTAQKLRCIGHCQECSALIESADRLNKKSNDLDAERLLVYQESPETRVKCGPLEKRLCALQKPGDMVITALEHYFAADERYDDLEQLVLKYGDHSQAVPDIWAMLLARNKVQELQENIDEYLNENPDNPDAWFYNARMAFRQGDTVNADCYMQKAIENGFWNIDLLKSEPRMFDDFLKKQKEAAAALCLNQLK